MKKLVTAVIVLAGLATVAGLWHRPRLPAPATTPAFRTPEATESFRPAAPLDSFQSAVRLDHRTGATPDPEAKRRIMERLKEEKK